MTKFGLAGGDLAYVAPKIQRTTALYHYIVLCANPYIFAYHTSGQLLQVAHLEPCVECAGQLALHEGSQRQTCLAYALSGW